MDLNDHGSVAYLVLIGRENTQAYVVYKYPQLLSFLKYIEKQYELISNKKKKFNDYVIFIYSI